MFNPNRQAPMFVVLLRYEKSMDEIDPLIPQHREWLDAQYARGVFLASGPQNPRVGGVILATGVSRERLNAILAEDPFQAVARYEVVEFTPSKTAEALRPLVGAH